MCKKIGDFNEDGYSDILVRSLLGVLHSVLSDGLGGFNSPGSALSGLPAGSIYFNDMNNDGVLDLLALDNLLGILTVSLGNGDGSFASGTTINVGVLPGDLIAVDINHDGFQDVIVLNVGGSSVTVLLGDGLGGLVEAVGQILDDLLGVIGGLIGGLPVAMVSADFNGDCRVDIAIWSDLNEEYVITLNQTGPDPSDLIFCAVFDDLSANL